MKAERPYPQIAITPKGEEALTGGHPWVYEGEVTSVTGSPADGGLVDVVSRRGSWLGAGFYSAESKIRVRVLSHDANERFESAFWERRVGYALDYRRAEGCLQIHALNARPATAVLTDIRAIELRLLAWLDAGQRPAAERKTA